jgi:hypothetical protein
MPGTAMENDKLETDVVAFARFEVLMAVVTKRYIVWDITSRSLLKVNLNLGGTY